MFLKIQLKKSIRDCKKRIEMLERKRTRSQAALVEAILTNSEPDNSDVDFFNMFTTQIDKERERLHKLTQELESLEEK